MPLNLRASSQIGNFNVPVSYRIHDRSGKFIDARNVYSAQNRLDTRFGYSRFNAVSLGGAVKSLSFFLKSDGTRYTIAKVGTRLKSVSETGAHTTIKTGLSANTKHRGVTGNNRHIISVEGDGLFSWDGTTFTQLGQAAPAAPTVASASGGDLIDTNIYKVGISFYASSIGFESNVGESATVTLSNPNKKIVVSNIPATADNGLIDKVYIYLKNVTANSAYIFVDEVNLGVTTFEIGTAPLSSQIPPLNNAPPRAGGGKYLTSFNSKLVYAGNEQFPNDVYFSEPDLPDAFDDLDSGLVLFIPGQGPITGLGVGLFGDTVLDPFLAIFKRKSTRIYSEIGGIAKMVVLSEEIGCVSAETIQCKNGILYFLSEEGWRAIANGRLVTNEQGEAITLGNGDIDDIFKSSGYVYEVNRNALANAFSVYYPTLDHYMTWVAEGSNAALTKTYVYEYDIGGFKPFEFALPATCATLGESRLGRDLVLFGTTDGFIMRYSIQEERSDVDGDNTPVPINAFAVRPWIPDGGDFDATYSFRELILRAVVSGNALTVKTFLNYNLANSESGDYNFADPEDGFILDESILDVDSFSDERTITTARSDINRVGESLAIGFYQNILGANIGLVSMQVDSNKNGNRNLPTDNDDEEGGFDSETQAYYPSVSASVLAAAQSAAEAAASAASIANSAVPQGGDPGDYLEKDTPTSTIWRTGALSGYSARFAEQFESTGLEDTILKILNFAYTAPAIALAASPSQAVREKGTVVSSVTLTATTTKRSEPITEVTFYRAGSLVHTESSPNPNGGIEVYTNSTAFSDNMTFYARVSDGISTIQSSTISYPFVYPYYHGAAAPGQTASQVATLTKSVITSNSNLNRTFTTSNGDVYYFAYPASYGALTSILDENGFDTFGDWTLRTENITGLDGNPVSYRIYEFNNPVVAGSTNYTFRR